jgi:hypothetical protein
MLGAGGGAPVCIFIGGGTLRFWLDAQARMEDHGECMLVLIGATPKGKKELIGFQVGVRESAKLARTTRRGEKPWAEDRSGNRRR